MRDAHMKRTLALVAMVGVLGAGCATKAQTGAVVGAGGGAVVGGAIGAATGNTARGAIIGAAVGGAAGAIIGDQMDRRAAELEDSIPGADVERVGEGILVTFESGILYDFDSDRIQAEGRENLTTLAESLERYPDSDLMIVGHTDSLGTESYNLDLSERRAAAAAAYLRQQGVADTRIKIAGRGELEPVSSNATDQGRQENRRVEVAIYANEALKERARQQAGS